MTPRTRLLALQRAQSDLEGDRAERRARIARARQAIGETELQIIAQGTALLEQANEELSRVQADLAEVEQSLAASGDVLARNRSGRRAPAPWSSSAFVRRAASFAAQASPSSTACAALFANRDLTAEFGAL